MNGLDINNLMSKKFGIALYAIYVVGNGGADPTVTVICQSAIAVGAMAVIWLLEKGEKNEKKTDILGGTNPPD